MHRKLCKKPDGRSFCKENSRKAWYKPSDILCRLQPCKRNKPFCSGSNDRKKNIDLSSQRPKGLEEIPYNYLDIVITLCDNAKQSCPNLPAKKHIHWDLPDPASFEGPPEAKKGSFLGRLEITLKKGFGIYYRVYT